MLDIYNQLRDFHVFKRFKYLFGDWWNMDILVVIKREKSFFYDNINDLNNSIVKSLLGSPLFKNNFLSSINTVIDKKASSSPTSMLLPWKQTGLSLFVAPLVLKNAPLEAFLVATGFAPGQEEKLRQSLLYLGLSETAIQQKMGHLKKLSQTDEVYIQKMLKILAEEFFSLLQKKKKQDHLIEKLNYRNRPYQSYGSMLGKAPAIQYIFNVLEKIKNYNASILIEGEKGTGKRLLAKTIHIQSSRSKKPFHLQNYSIFKGKLLEREVFGYSHKAFPKAFKGKKALLEKIEGGTLLLNEIENTSLEFQSQLLRFLKEGVLFVKGGLKQKRSNVRILAATSKNLKALVEEGLFSEDLYFAISAMTVKIPSLRHRKEDIPLLVNHFVKTKSPLKKIKFSSEAMAALYDYHWPGNIRELENEMEKILSLNSQNKSLFTKQDLSPHIRDASSDLTAVFPFEKKNLKDALRSVEKQILLDCLRKNNWNKTRVAKLLGTSRTSIILKAKEYGIIRKEGA